MNRNLDSIYFRVERDGEWTNVCFSDLTDEECEKLTKKWKKENWITVSLCLRKQLKFLGDYLDVVIEDKDEV